MAKALGSIRQKIAEVIQSINIKGKSKATLFLIMLLWKALNFTGVK